MNLQRSWYTTSVTACLSDGPDTVLTMYMFVLVGSVMQIKEDRRTDGSRLARQALALADMPNVICLRWPSMCRLERGVVLGLQCRPYLSLPLFVGFENGSDCSCQGQRLMYEDEVSFLLSSMTERCWDTSALFQATGCFPTLCLRAYTKFRHAVVAGRSRPSSCTLNSQ